MTGDPSEKDYPPVPDKTLDELILECDDPSILKAAILEVWEQRNTWIIEANGPECAETINDEDEQLRTILKGDV